MILTPWRINERKTLINILNMCARAFSFLSTRQRTGDKGATPFKGSIVSAELLYQVQRINPIQCSKSNIQRPSNEQTRPVDDFQRQMKTVTEIPAL